MDLKTPTSRLYSAKDRTSMRSSSGFTMLELLIVLVIIGLMLAVAVPTVNSLTGVYLKTSSAKLAGNIKYLYDKSVLDNLYFRLVIDLDNKTYHPESSEVAFFLSQKAATIDQGAIVEEEEDEEEDEIKSLSIINDTENLTWDGWNEFAARYQKKKASFTTFTSELSKRVTFPEEIAILGVYTPAVEEPVTRGKVYIHFFPHGYVEPTVIWLADASDVAAELPEDEMEVFTILIRPLTGRAQIFDYKHDLPEVIEDEEEF